jgi:hypothetical protein
MKKHGITIDGIYAAARLYQGGKISKEIIISPADDDSTLINTLTAVSEMI